MPRDADPRLEVVQIGLMSQTIVGRGKQKSAFERQTGHLKGAVGIRIEADILSVVSLRVRRFIVPSPTKIDGQGARHAPVVLQEEAVVVITPGRIRIEYSTTARGIAQ